MLKLYIFSWKFHLTPAVNDEARELTTPRCFFNGRLVKVCLLRTRLSFCVSGDGEQDRQNEEWERANEIESYLLFSDKSTN